MIDPEFERQARILAKAIHHSKVVVSVVPEGEVDMKFAVELGASIMLDKPIVAMIRPGTKIPKKLALVVDEWVEFDASNVADSQQRLQEALKRLID